MIPIWIMVAAYYRVRFGRVEEVGSHPRPQSVRVKRAERGGSPRILLGLAPAVR